MAATLEECEKLEEMLSRGEEPTISELESFLRERFGEDRWTKAIEVIAKERPERRLETIGFIVRSFTPGGVDMIDKMLELLSADHVSI